MSNIEEKLFVAASALSIKLISFPEAFRENINELIRLLNPNKFKGPDGIPLMTQVIMYFPKIIWAYRKKRSSNYAPLLLIENWKEKHGKGYLVVTALEKLSKALDCILHDPLITKLHVYGVDKDALTFFILLFKKKKTMC